MQIIKEGIRDRNLADNKRIEHHYKNTFNNNAVKGYNPRKQKIYKFHRAGHCLFGQRVGAISLYLE
jgi:hypothetical protein